jgi:hypothetical protein
MTKNAIFGKNNADLRFHIMNNMFVIIGTPLFPVEGSCIYGVYRLVAYAGLYLTFVTIFIGILNNLDDMAYVIESARPGIAVFNVLWTHFFMRYCYPERPRMHRVSFTNRRNVRLRLSSISPVEYSELSNVSANFASAIFLASVSERI